MAPTGKQRHCLTRITVQFNVSAMEGCDTKGKKQCCLRSGDRMVKRDDFGPTTVPTDVRVLDGVTRNRDKREGSRPSFVIFSSRSTRVRYSNQRERCRKNKSRGDHYFDGNMGRRSGVLLTYCLRRVGSRWKWVRSRGKTDFSQLFLRKAQNLCCKARLCSR
jgi:hypothetical protein